MDEAATEERSALVLALQLLSPAPKMQDSTKQSYRVVVCLDSRTGTACPTVLIAAASLALEKHVVGLLFALEDFVARGYHTLPDGQSATNVLSREVEARPLWTVPIVKAVSGGRRRPQNGIVPCVSELNFSNYNLREEKHRKPGIESLLKAPHQLVERDAGDCNFTRILTHKRKHSHSQVKPAKAVELFEPTQLTCLSELARDEDIPISFVIDADIMGTCQARERCPWYRKDSPSSSLQQEYRQSVTLTLWTICWSTLAESRIGEAETFYCWESWTWKLHSHTGQEWHLACRACWSHFHLSVSWHNDWLFEVENSISICGQDYKVPMYR